jgi:hypothetical protein
MKKKSDLKSIRRVLPVRWSLFVLAGMAMMSMASGFSQKLIENSEKPAAANAGRTLQLERVWSIADEAGRFFFKSPEDLEIGVDGSVFVADEYEILKFGSDGSFRGNFFKKGQGPGEIAGAMGISIDVFNNELIICDLGTSRIIRTDLEGKFKSQVSVRDSGIFIGMSERGMIFRRGRFPIEEKRNDMLVDVPHEFTMISPDGISVFKVGILTNRAFKTSRGFQSYDPLQAVLSEDRGRVFAAYLRDEYRIAYLDLDGKGLLRSFSRKFPMVPHVITEREERASRMFVLPKIKFEPPIERLFMVDGRLWIQTAVRDEGRGDLLDVFDEEGRFLDSFFLGSPGTLMAGGGGFLYIRETAPDESFRIVKYRITPSLRSTGNP